MAGVREVVEGTQAQGIDEQIVYTVDVTNWGSTPSSTAVVVKDSSGADVTSTIMPTGSTSVTNNIITLPTAKAMTEGGIYRVEVKFTISGNILECHFFISAEL